MIHVVEIAPGAVTKRAFDVNTGDTLLLPEPGRQDQALHHWLIQRIVRGFGNDPRVTFTGRSRSMGTKDFSYGVDAMVTVIPREHYL